MTGRFLMILALVIVAGCATSPVRRQDGELRVLTEAGTAACEQGQPVKAAALYGQAYQRGLLIDESLEAGRNAYNAALCHVALNQAEEAVRLLGEARRLLAPDAVAMTRVDMLEAEMRFRAGNRVAAGDFARRVLAGRPGKPERCQAALLLAEMALIDGDRAAALSWFKVARGTGAKGMAPLLAGRREGTAGRLIQDGVMKGDAGGRFLAQAMYLREGGAYGEMAGALMTAGDVYAAAGRIAEAVESYERAVNTFVALGDKPAAAKGVAKAEAAVAASGSMAYKDYTERVRLLRALVGK